MELSDEVLHSSSGSAGVVEEPAESQAPTARFPLPQPMPPPSSGLRVYLSVNLVAQGFVAPFTPMGASFFRSIMAGFALWRRKPPSRPLEGSGPEAPPAGVALTLGRLYFDATYVLQSERWRTWTIARLRWKDPAASDALREWLDANADRLPSRSRSVGTWVLVARWLARQLPDHLRAIVAPERTAQRLVARADAEIASLERQAALARTPLEQLDLVGRVLPPRLLALIFDELPPVTVGLLATVLAEALVKRWLGEGYDTAPIARSLPHNPTTEMGLALWRLSRELAAEGQEPTPHSLATFLANFGHRAPDREIDVGVPRFAEDYAYLLELLRGYRRQGDNADPLRRFEMGRTAAEACARDLVVAMRRERGAVRSFLLQGLLYRARALAGLRERPKFDLVRGIALARKELQKLGRAVVEDGELEEVDDIFFLDLERLQDALTPSGGCMGDVRRGPRADWRELVKQNRHQYEQELLRPAIPRIITNEGEAIYGPAREGLSSALTERESRSEEGAAEETDTISVLIGTPASPGVHEGRARVLDTPGGGQLEPGEVLVAATTDPGWTPLFLSAGALVMEVGGVISHGAVVAREYGIPAVVGVPGATEILRSGQWVRVDGGRGTVSVLASPGPADGDRKDEMSSRPKPTS